MSYMRSLEDTVNLRVAADAAYTQVVRLATFMVASRLDFDLSRIEDLRIAVDEASNYAILNRVDQGRLSVSIQARPEDLEILISFEKKNDGSNTDLGVFSRMILESVLDDFRLDDEGHHSRILLMKRRQ
ncbi:MAG: ATP-binding protein [Candidatus Geothermincolia bacterium]